MSWWVGALTASTGAAVVHRFESAGWIAVVISLGVCVLGSLTGAAASAVRGARERRIVRAWARSAAGGAQREVDAQSGGAASGRLIGAGSGRHRGRAQGPPTPRELSLLVAEVSTRLRSGSPAAEAWRLALGRIGAGGAEEQGQDSCPRIVAQWREPRAAGAFPPRARAPPMPLVPAPSPSLWPADTVTGSVRPWPMSSMPSGERSTMLKRSPRRGEWLPRAPSCPPAS